LQSHQSPKKQQQQNKSQNTTGIGTEVGRDPAGQGDRPEVAAKGAIQLFGHLLCKLCRQANDARCT